jgi:hypothetical protein
MALGTTRDTRPDDGARKEGWLRDGVLAGFVATFAMTVVLAAAYGFARAVGDQDGSTIEKWFYALARNPVTERPEDAPFTAIGLNLLVGLVLGVVYARVAEPMLSGPGWRRGVLFSLLPWLVSIALFLPIMGGGFLGMDIDAGPLPVLGNLILHLVYGTVLGAVYSLRVEQGLDNPTAERAAAERSERGAAIGVGVGVVGGALAGWLVDAAIEDVGSVATAIVVGALIGAAIGLLVGSLLGIGSLGFDERGAGIEAPR